MHSPTKKQKMLVLPLKIFCTGAELSTKRTVKNRTACSEIPRETQFPRLGSAFKCYFRSSALPHLQLFTCIGRNNSGQIEV
ncbi:hypothetical protein QN277_021252 [Acacia crassicarpa]|uniref:Uncharacterized protein n=1 Tax=Acacia crassicarpa TaxID=499986 RepID=A0AAE1MSW8_9FABA|nr:hypothetical protein QN277_021252 [Acacia crassicarpa]